jgi:hypothetical protein
MKGPKGIILASELGMRLWLAAVSLCKLHQTSRREECSSARYLEQRLEHQHA